MNKAQLYKKKVSVTEHNKKQIVDVMDRLEA